jgi:hypothetical protein
MSAITTASSSTTSAVASLLSNSASSATADAGTSAKATATDPATSSSRDPVDTVDLSDRAKATLARAKTERFAAGKLAAQVAATNSPGGKDKVTKSTSDDGAKLFDTLSGRAQSQQTGNTQWEAGAPYGDASISDADFTAELKGTLSQWADEYDKKGLPSEVGQALRDAVANGTLKFQKASDVPDLNFHSAHTFTPNAFGTLDGWGSTSQNPTGTTKEAIDQGKAIAMWSADRGDVYVTW